MTKKGSGKSFLFGAALGAAAGAVVAFFKSPRSGKENQALAKKVIEDVKDKASDIAQDVAERGKHVAESVADNYASTKLQAEASGKQIGKASGKFVDRLKSDVKEVYHDAKKETSAAVESAKKKFKK